MGQQGYHQHKPYKKWPLAQLHILFLPLIPTKLDMQLVYYKHLV
jgi:hypothetical protein